MKTTIPVAADNVGAYPIKHHLECAERTRKGVSYPQAFKVEPTDGLRARLDAGVRFEALWTMWWLDNDRSLGRQVIEVCCGSRPTGNQIGVNAALELLSGRMRRDIETTVYVEIADRESASAKRSAEKVTIAAMAAGVDTILGGRLVGNGRSGEPDILLRHQHGNRRKHAFRYLGGDFKDHRSFDGQAKSREWSASPISTPWVEFAAAYEAEGTPQIKDSLQLVHYWYLLDHVGRAGPRTGGIVGREGVVIWRDLDAKLYERRKRTAFEIYDEAYASYRDAVRHERARMMDPSLPEASGPEWKGACGDCEWREVCHDELKELGHITLLPGITPDRARAHYAAGVSSIRELATLDSRTARLVDAGVPVDSLLANASVAEPDEPVGELGASNDQRTVLTREGVRCAADVSGLDARTALYASTGVSNLAMAIDQARVALADRVHRARGVEFVSVPRAAIELDVDIEDVGGGICYLIGVKETRRSRGSVESAFVPFITWGNTEAAEAENFAAFWRYVTDTIEAAARSRTGAVRIFVWSGHEERYFAHMAEAHAGIPGVPTVAEVKELCASEIWVDMYPVLAKQLVWPTEDLTLKSLAKYARHMWRDETPGGANSVAWYNGQLGADERGDTDTRDELRQRLLDYNEDDVVATYALREFISKMGEARRPGQKLPGVEDLDRTWGPGRPRTPRRR